MSATLIAAVGYGLMSFATYAAYAIDKSAARRRRHRVPESTLHLLALLGGWPGALLAQRRLRHKTSKSRFQLLYWLTVALNVLVVALLITAIR